MELSNPTHKLIVNNSSVLLSIFYMINSEFISTYSMKVVNCTICDMATPYQEALLVVQLSGIIVSHFMTLQDPQYRTMAKQLSNSTLRGFSF